MRRSQGHDDRTRSNGRRRLLSATAWTAAGLLVAGGSSAAAFDDPVAAPSLDRGGASAPSEPMVQTAQTDRKRDFAIPAQDLNGGLLAFAETTGVQLFYEVETLRGLETDGVRGRYTPERALRQLLSGTGLTYSFSDGDTVTIAEAQPQEQGGPAQLGPITVEATGESAYGPVEGYKPERSATATRTDTPIQDLPASIQVVPREVIEDQNAQDLPEVVRNVSSVFVDNSFGGIGRDFNIRGFNQDFKLRNGFREEGTATTRTQELANVERVEVLKGPSSIISGRLAPGGVVNVVTERPTAEPMRRFELEGGTTIEGGHRTQPSIDLSGPLTDDGGIKYRLNALYSHKDSYREPFDQDFERIFLAPVVSFELGPDTDLLVEAEYTNDERPFDRGIVHFNGTFSDRDRNLQSDSVVNRSETAIAGYTLEHAFSDTLRLRHRSQVLWQERFNLENVPFAPATNFPGLFPNATRGDFARFIGSNDAVDITYSTQTELNATLDGPLAAHDVLFAVDFSRDEEDRVFQSSDPSFAFPTFQGVPNRINIFNPVDAVPPPTPGDLTFRSNDVDNVTEEFGLLLQDQISLSEQWELLLGGRLTWVNQQRIDTIAGTDDTQEENAVFSPRAGLVYKPVKNVSLYGSYSESFEPNSAQDRAGDFLEPTRGEQFEAGVKAEFLDGRLRTTLAGFQITKTNIPRSVNLPGGSFSVATGEQRSRGIELDVTGEVADGWRVIGSYAFLDTEITEDDSNEGNELSGVPTHSASFWSNYEVQTGTLQGLQLGAGVFYRGERQADNANSFQLPSFARVDARIGYRQDAWEVNLTLKNVLDTNENFEAVDFGPLVKPGIPFTAIASVSLKF